MTIKEKKDLYEKMGQYFDEKLNDDCATLEEQTDLAKAMHIIFEDIRNYYYLLEE